ncbi:hypothetical protein FPHYL_6246 [Fusarium phyllophilum]|uniref:Uncharacterized protein n=1 Tax=Fusarium phyllophilum TaxID=47803 RepID=A0A8H5NC76_9HYPO|nr:hypothetical protein FPHYL_6246 [Fusarium phyllophilum]
MEFFKRSELHSMNSGLKALNLMAQFQRLPVPGTSIQPLPAISPGQDGFLVCSFPFPALHSSRPYPDLVNLVLPQMTTLDLPSFIQVCSKYHSVDLIFVYDDGFDRRLSPPSSASGNCA